MRSTGPRRPWCGAWVLWGSKPGYADGTALKLTVGSARDVAASRRLRIREGGWRLRTARCVAVHDGEPLCAGCGAYPATWDCSRCGGTADRGDIALQGRWYGCRECSRPMLVIDFCECEEPCAGEPHADSDTPGAQPCPACPGWLAPAAAQEGPRKGPSGGPGRAQEGAQGPHTAPPGARG